MDYNASWLVETFSIPVGRYSLEYLHHGHINRTFRVRNDEKPVYILQQINTAIFNKPDQLMANYNLVTKVLSANDWFINTGLKVPGIILTRQGNLFAKDHQSNCVRLITYIEGSDIGSVIRDTNTACEGGLAFGAFLKGVSGINPHALYPILPDFHSFKKRYNDFVSAVKSDRCGRAILISEEIEFVESRFQQMMKIPDMIDSGAIPERVVHNDTKLTNIIFRDNGKAAGVIDLDTVMPGSALFDFGDAIRSLANTALEDEQDLTKVNFEISFFEAFLKGYLQSANELLCKAEKDLLPESALLLTFIIGIRFLTDYLNNDIYYHIQYPDHNLVRARVQFRLLSQMESQLDEMHKIMSRLQQNSLQSTFIETN